MKRALLLIACLGIGGGSIGSCSSKPKGCAIGSESCDCTAGGACDPGLECRSMLCVNPLHGPGSAGSGGGAGGSGGVASGSGGAGGSVVGAPVCSFPIGSAFAKESHDQLGQSKDFFSLAFAGGRLTQMDGKACTPDTSGTKPIGDWATWPCMDAYACGGCVMFLIDPDPQAPKNPWMLLGAYTATGFGTTGCPEYSGVYDICLPDCSLTVDGGVMTRICGNDGCNGSTCGSCSGPHACCNGGTSCVVDRCAECLDACQNLPSCCTGVGCQCEGACATTYCAP